MNKENHKIKNRYDVRNASNKAVKTAPSTMIQAYVTENKQTLIKGEKRSMELPLITIGLEKAMKFLFLILKWLLY